MKNTQKYLRGFFALLLAVCLISVQGAPLWADGLQLYGMSAEGQSRADAVTASVDDASAVWYNPAALMNLKQPDVSVNLNNLIAWSKFSNTTGTTENSTQHYFPLTSVYAASKLSDDLAFGIGVNTPFGLATQYNNNSPFAYFTTGGSIELIDINPSVAYQINSQFSVGAGLDYYYSSAQLTSQYPWAAITHTAVPDGTVNINGTGDGIGYNVGALYSPTPDQSIGLTYRSSVLVTYSGDQAQITNAPGGLGNAYETSAQTNVRYPDMVNFGYAYKGFERWVVEVGGQWTRWNTFQSLSIGLQQPTAFFPSPSIPLNWNNSYSIRIGAEHRLSDNWSIAGGYSFMESPVPASTYSPLIPDGDEHYFTFAPKYENGNLTISTPLALIVQPTKSVTSGLTTNGSANPFGANLNGTYSLFAMQIGIGATYRFGH